MVKLITKENEKQLAKHPFGSSDGKGRSAEVLFEIFNPYGVGTWLILEGEKKENGKYDFYGLVNLGVGWEYGYFSQEELEEVRVSMLPFLPETEPLERDRYASGTVADFIKEAHTM